MKRFCKDLKEHATKIINCEKKVMVPLTKEEKEDYNNQKVCYICKKEFIDDKVRDHCHYTGKYRGAAHNTCNLRYKIPKNIPVIFNNGSTYDYHFIIRELQKEFEGNFECLGENTEKYITFSVPIKKRIENKDIEITYKIKFVDSFRFMATSLSKLVGNLTEGIHNDKCINGKSNLCYMKVTDKKLIFRCFECKKNYEKEINKELVERFSNTYEFCDKDLNNLYGKAMTETLPGRGFRWMDDISRMDEDFVRGYDKNDIKGYILEVDVDYPNELQNLHRNLPFLPERMVINNTKKLVCNLHDLCCAYQCIKTSFRSWVAIKKVSQSN